MTATITLDKCGVVANRFGVLANVSRLCPEPNTFSNKEAVKMDGHGHSLRLKEVATHDGRLVRRMITTIVGVLALWVAVPAVASARVEWRLNAVPLSGSVATEWKGKVKVTDTNTPLGKQAVECTDKAEGTVGAGGAGEVTKVTTSACTGVQLCQKTEASTSITPLNLPWHTELVMVEGSLRDRLVNGGKGTPGVKVECLIASIKVTDECSGTLGTVLTNTESNVTAAFSNAEKLNCTLGGTGSGIVEGTQTVTASAGGNLTAIHEEPPVWLKNGVAIESNKSITWTKGTLELVDHSNSFAGALSMKCEDSGEGVVGTSGSGSTTKMTLSKCVPGIESKCASGSLEAANLSWNTELFSGLESAVRELVKTSGAGTPSVWMKCVISGFGEWEDRCAYVPTINMKNNTEVGVTATFSSEHFHCSLSESSTAAELRESSLTLNLTSGETLHVS